MNRSQLTVGLLLTFLAGLLAMHGLGITRRGGGPAVVIDNPATWEDTAASVPISSDDPIWGSRTAPVTLVLFSDFQCGYCKKLEDTLDTIKKDYGPQKLRIVFKHAPLVHKKARPAHEAAARIYMLAGSDAYWEYHATSFEHSSDLTDVNFVAWAKGVEVDAAKFNDPTIVERATKKLDQDLALAKTLNVRGTPASFINGLFISGNQPIAEFRKVIDAQLHEAEKLKGAGTPEDKIYVALTNKNRPPKDAPAPVASEEVPDAEPDTKRPKKDKGTAQEDDPRVYRAPIGDSPAKGPADALITVVQFGNFESPYAGMAQGTLDELVKANEGKIRLVWKHLPLPFHKRGTPASLVAEMAREAKGAEGFWAAHAALFDAEKKAVEAKASDLFSEAQLLEIAKGLGLDAAKVKPVIADADPSSESFEPSAAAKKYMAAIEADADLGDRLEVDTVPWVFINGRRVVGAQGLEKFQQIVDQELGKAEALVAAGTKKDQLYDVVMKDATEPDLPPTRLIDPVGGGTPTRGPESAKVEVHLFSEFQCPFCKQVQPTLGVMFEAYKGRVRFVWHDRPLGKHELAPLAASAAREAFAQKGEAGFWAYHDELFKLTKTPDFKRESFEKIAEKQGLDMKAFKAALDENKHLPTVQAEIQRANTYDISGTPSFVVTFGKKGDKLHGFFLSGALAPSKFRRTINLALAIAAGEKPAPAAPDPATKREAPSGSSDEGE